MAQWRSALKGIDTQGDNRVEVNLSGGIYTGINSFDIKDQQSVNEYGWDTDEFYPAKSTAKSPVTYGTSGGSTTNLLTSLGSTHLVRAVGTKLQYDASGIWTDIAGTFSSIPWGATNFDVNGPALLLTNGTDPVKQWNGTTLADLTGAPKGKVIAADNLRVFISDVATDEAQDHIHYCAFQDALDWTSAENSGIVQYYTANGGAVTAMISFSGQIWVFKKDSFALIYHTGDARAFYRLVPSSDNIGCVASRTLVDIGETLCWLGMDDVYIGAAGSASRIGEPIRMFLSRINQAHINKCDAFSDGLRYYLNLVIDSATTPNIRLSYDTRFKIWSVCALNEGYLQGTWFNNSIYAGNTTGQTYKLNAAPTTGAFMVETKDFDRSEAEKEYNELHQQIYTPTGTTLTVQASVDQGTTWFTFGDPVVAQASAQNQNLIIPLDTLPLGYWVRFRFLGTGEFRFYSFERYFRLHPVQH